ncbi:hypothetical protein L0Z64_19325 (plasmid) [Phaeobacter sp. BS23]|uniref:hypothetical protein n=1 Tax=Phaeobacter sp. BS23 TaxID=2907239 RepID=UPI0037049D6D
MTEDISFVAKAILGNLQSRPDHPALVINDKVYFYRRLIKTVQAIVEITAQSAALTGVLGKGGYSAYAGILAGYMATAAGCF